MVQTPVQARRERTAIYAADLKWSNRTASRSLSGRSRTRSGRWIMRPCSCFN